MGTLYDKIKSKSAVATTTTSSGTSSGGSLYNKIKKDVETSGPVVVAKPTVTTKTATPVAKTTTKKGPIAQVVDDVKSLVKPGGITPKDVFAEIPTATKKVANSFAETFAPSITNFFKTTGNIFGEGLAYAVDPNVRKQYKAGNLDVLPVISKTTLPDIAKDTISAGIETAIARTFPGIGKLSIGKRFGAGALQGVGFAIAEGMANDKTVDEIMDSLPEYGVSAGVIGTLTPYLAPLLKADAGNLPAEIKSIFKGLRDEIVPPKPKKLGIKFDTVETPVRTPAVPPQAVSTLNETNLEPLIQEARKYKSAKEFVKDVSISEIRYQLRSGLDKIAKETNVKSLTGTQKTGEETVAYWKKKIQENIMDPGKKGTEGFAPIIVDGNKVVDGFHKLQAYKELGFGKVPTIDKSQLTDIWERANKVKEVDLPPLRVMTPGKKYQEYIKSQGYEPYQTPDTLSISTDAPKNIQITPQRAITPKDGEYSVIHQGGIIEKVQGEPIKILDDIDTFIHKDENGNWAVSETTTGRNITGGGYKNKTFAIKTARENLNSIDRAELRKLISNNQLTDVLTNSPINNAVDDIVPETRITSVPKDQLPISSDGKTRVSRLESRIKGILDDPNVQKRAELEGVTTYNQMNKKEQINKAIKFVQKNEEDAMAVLRGEKPAPDGLLHNSISLALEQKAVDSNNANLAMKLASLRSTRAGQEISILTEADPSNPISQMNEIIKARVNRVQRVTKVKNISEVVTKKVKEAKAVVTKEQLKISDAEELLANLLC